MIVFSLETNNQILKPSSFHCVRISSSPKNNCLAFGCSFVQYYINEIIWRLFRSQFGNIGDVFGYFSNHMTVMQFSSEFLVWFQWLLFPKTKIIESGSTREMMKKRDVCFLRLTLGSNSLVRWTLELTWPRLQMYVSQLHIRGSGCSAFSSHTQKRKWKELNTHNLLWRWALRK